MKGTSKVIMGATLAMVVILAVVLGLVLVLLAELYCSLLLRRQRWRRQLPITTSNTTSAAATTTAAATTAAANDSSSQLRPLQGQSLVPQSLRSLYAHGVLSAPRSFLFPPAVYGKEDKAVVGIEKHHTTQRPPPTTTTTTASSPPPSPPFVISLTPPKPIEKTAFQTDTTGGCNSGACGGSGGVGDHLVYISNPIYDNDEGGRVDTPFETPDTSPSRLEDGDFSGEDTVQSLQSSPDSSAALNTPPLTPMKKLPAEASSVSLRDARSLATSGSDDSNSHNGLSSSSSGSPCTSPSW